MEQNRKQEKGDEKEWVILTTVSNDIEAGIVEGVLEMAEIPIVKRTEGVDGFIKIILGVPVRGIDIYVPADRLEEARELLQADMAVEDMEEDNQGGDT